MGQGLRQQALHVPVGEAVVDLLALPAEVHEPRLAEKPELVAHRRDRDHGEEGEVADAKLPHRLEGEEQAHPRGVGKGLEEEGGLLDHPLLGQGGPGLLHPFRVDLVDPADRPTSPAWQAFPPP